MAHSTDGALRGFLSLRSAMKGGLPEKFAIKVSGLRSSPCIISATLCCIAVDTVTAATLKKEYVSIVKTRRSSAVVGR